MFLSELPRDVRRYYSSGYHGFDQDGEPDWKRSPELMLADRFRVDLLAHHAAPGRLIEVGSGAGGFASAAAAAGHQVTAIEMDRACCEYLRDHVGVEAICSDDPVNALGSLGCSRVIAMWHVLEHMPDPAAVFRAVVAKLEPGGVLALGVPNPGALQFRLLGRRWAHLDAPRHFSLIPATALIERGQELGLACVELMADDPFGVHCNMFGWAYALRRRPARGTTSGPVIGAARALTRAFAPIEHRAGLGTAVTLLLRREG